ncbi:formate dehydrogenase [Bradyrhizobium sp. RDM12]
MKSFFLAKVHRRDVFRVAAAGAAIATGGAMVDQATAAESTGSADKRRARYQEDAAEVQNYYRVNRYPARREK